jgi:hypothetical protein
MKATTSGSFKPVPLPEPQTTVARCYSLIDIGTVPNIYKNKVEGTVRKVFITWELPLLKAVFKDERGPEPFVISEEMTLSTKDNSNFAKVVKAWRGKGFTPEEEKEFDPTVMVGKTCIIQFEHNTKSKFKGQTIKEITNENTAMKLGAIMKRPPAMECPPQINPSLIWDWEEIANTKVFDKEKWEKIPNFVKEKIKTSEEYAKFAPKDIAGEDNASGTQTPAQGYAPKADETVTKEDW